MIDRGSIDLVGNDLLQISRQERERALVAKDPIAVPDVAGKAAALLYLVEASGGDDRERVFLPFDDLGLQRRVELIEIDRRGS